MNFMVSEVESCGVSPTVFAQVILWGGGSGSLSGSLTPGTPHAQCTTGLVSQFMGQRLSVVLKLLLLVCCVGGWFLSVIVTSIEAAVSIPSVPKLRSVGPSLGRLKMAK